MTEVEKKGIGKAKVVLGVSIAVLVVSLISNAWLYTQTTSLQTEVSKVGSEYDDYVATHSHPDSEYQELSTNYTQLQQNYQTLTTEYETLTESYSQLLLDFNNLTDEPQTLTETYNQLQTSYQQLNTTYYDLQREHEQLETMYQTLNAAYDSYKAAYRQLVSVVNLHVDHPSQNEELLITPEDPAVESKVEEITGGWSDPTDWTEYWDDVKKMYDWVVNNIEYRYAGLYPILPADPSYQVRQFGEMWHSPTRR